jgi:hypothetical protein
MHKFALVITCFIVPEKFGLQNPGIMKGLQGVKPCTFNYLSYILNGLFIN